MFYSKKYEQGDKGESLPATRIKLIQLLTEQKAAGEIIKKHLGSNTI